MDRSLSKLHALVLPFPAQGHINPLLYLSTQLALKGATVTFVNTEKTHESMLKARCEPSDLHIRQPENLDIRFVAIPDGMPKDQKPSGVDTSFNTLATLLDGIQMQRGLLEEMIKSSESESSPISCIISDSFFPWTQDLADRVRIARVVFWTSNATNFRLSWLETAGKLPSEEMNGPEPVDLHIPGLPLFHKEIWSIRNEMRSKFLEHEPDLVKFFTQRFVGIQDTASIVVNTLRELEGSVLNTIPYPCPVRFVGPLLPPGVLGDSKPIVGGSLFREESSCLQWLDTNSACSVLYIAFGSYGTVSSAQLEQLALGIEASTQPFLWVVRAGTETGSHFPEGFTERTKDRGRLISWAPQLRVLSHPSVGGFLTHCGWNSVLDSISAGVPMLGLPLFADQPLNLALVEKIWEVGVELKKGEDGMVSKEEVEREVRGVMQSEGGRELRKRCGEMREAARRSVREGGVSASDLQLLAEDVLRKFEDFRK